MKRFVTIIIFVFLSGFLKAQQDTTVLRQKEITQQKQKDSVTNTPPKKVLIKNTDSNSIISVPVKKIDTAKFIAKTDSLKADTIQNAKKAGNKNYDSVLAIIGLPFFANPVFMLMPAKIPHDKDEMFYIIISVFFLLAFTKFLFPNYLKKTVGLFLQTTSISTDTKYSVQQNSIAFIFLWLVFIFCAGIYVTLVTKRFYNDFNYSFWEIVAFFICFLCCFYIAKYVIIKFLGWVFNLQTEANVFLLFIFWVSRITGIVLIPVISILAFSIDVIAYTTFVISIFIIAMFWMYGYFLAIKSIQQKLHANALQIFLYLCAVEVLPIVLLYKLIVDYTRGMN